MTDHASSPSLRTLLRRVVDYAGLFPPASRSMPDAVARHAAHLRSADAWMLGRFVLRVEQLDEFALAAEPLIADGDEPWRMSAIIGSDLAAAGPTIRAFNTAHRGKLLVDVVECQPIPQGGITKAVGVLPGEVRIFVEIPIVEDPQPLLLELATAGAWAKMRTGGVLQGSTPAAFQVARLIARAAETRIPFKATAGLHHPHGGDFPLTCDDDAPRERMFGFLNVLTAAVLAQQNLSVKRLVEVLEDDEPTSITFASDCLRWRERSATLKQIASARSSLAISFGSCSFAEPLEGLRVLGLL